MFVDCTYLCAINMMVSNKSMRCGLIVMYPKNNLPNISGGDPLLIFSVLSVSSVVKNDFSRDRQT